MKEVFIVETKQADILYWNGVPIKYAKTYAERMELRTMAQELTTKTRGGKDIDTTDVLDAGSDVVMGNPDHVIDFYDAGFGDQLYTMEQLENRPLTIYAYEQKHHAKNGPYLILSVRFANEQNESVDAKCIAGGTNLLEKVPQFFKLHPQASFRCFWCRRINANTGREFWFVGDVRELERLQQALPNITEVPY